MIQDEVGHPSAYSSTWALYENWRSENELSAAGGERLAFYDPWFAVLDPSRYSRAGAGQIGRTLDLAWEVEDNGGVANRPPWTTVATGESFAFDDPRSPFDGANREFYLRDTQITNAGGPRRWYTDPYGQNGSRQPFPGSVCQLVAPRDTSAYPPLKQRLFGRDRDYGRGNGVHAPN